MIKIFNISGKFASGKSTVIDLLNKEYNYPKVITCTTRKKRENEREGIDYYFLTDEQFSKHEENGDMIAVNYVYDKNGKISKKYGVLTSKINTEDSVIICPLEPNGYKELVNKFGTIVVKGVYLDISDRERFLRVLSREAKPDMDAYCQRFGIEKETFEGFELMVDKVIDNSGTSDIAAEKINEYILSVINKN